jgi:diguanylate cyclase (GGDEF)-like protein
MISIQSSLTELERSHQLREAVLDCYLNAVNSVAHYALELDEEVTKQFRKHLSALSGEISLGKVDLLADSRATLRGLLRDFRDRNSAYVANLRDELAGTVRALEEILDTLAQTDGDSDVRMRSALRKLRSAVAPDAGTILGVLVAGAADVIEQSIDQMRKQHQLTVSQFITEIRVLHKRIDALESAASLDLLTKLANRNEMTERIRLAAPGEYCLLLIGVRGFLRAEVQSGKEVGEELAAAFVKRLRNSVPATAEAARWGVEEFVVLVSAKKSDALSLGKWISENLSGPYVCLKAGKAIRPNVQVTVGIVDTAPREAADHIVRRIDIFFGR